MSLGGNHYQFLPTHEQEQKGRQEFLSNRPWGFGEGAAGFHHKKGVSFGREFLSNQGPEGIKKGIYTLEQQGSIGEAAAEETSNNQP